LYEVCTNAQGAFCRMRGCEGASNEGQCERVQVGVQAVPRCHDPGRIVRRLSNLPMLGIAEQRPQFVNFCRPFLLPIPLTAALDP